MQNGEVREGEYQGNCAKEEYLLSFVAKLEMACVHDAECHMISSDSRLDR